MTKTQLATQALTVAAPEFAIPAQAALAIAGQLRRKSPPSAPEAKGDVLLVPPPDKPLLLELRKQRIRVRVRKGIRIVTVDPARGFTAAETVVVGTIGLAAYGAYEAAKALNADVQSFTNPSKAWWNPANWIPKHT